MLIVVPGSELSRQQALMDRAFRFRHAVFVEEQGRVNFHGSDERERDQFDDENAVHQICLRKGEIAGYQRLLPTTRPDLLTEVLEDLCREVPPTGPAVYEWTRLCVARPHRDLRLPVNESVFLELALGIVEWSMTHDIHTVTVAIDPRLMVITMQLGFFVRPLGFPKRVGQEEVVALRMSFNRQTLARLHEARTSET